MTVNTIHIDKTATGYAIAFPFELKDVFKATFPRARWDAAARRWTVGPRSGKRLQQWADEATKVAAELDARDAEVLADAELDQLRASLARVSADIARSRSSTRTLADTRQLIESDRASLEAARTDLAAVKVEQQAERAILSNLLASVVCLDTIRGSHAVMCRLSGKVGRVHKDQFENARLAILAETKRLRAAGYTSAGLEDLASANYNRPDRDNPASVTEADYLKITARESGEDD